MWKSTYVGVYQLLNWKMHGETLKYFILLSLLNLRLSSTRNFVPENLIFHCKTSLIYIFDTYSHSKISELYHIFYKLRLVLICFLIMDYGKNLSPRVSKSRKQKYCKFIQQNFLYINLATIKFRLATRKSQSSHNGFVSSHPSQGAMWSQLLTVF